MTRAELLNTLKITELPTRDAGSVMAALTRIESELVMIRRYTGVNLQLAPEELKPSKESKK